MPTYVYTALNEHGVNMQGAIDADSPETARALLLSRGYVPMKVKAQGAGLELGALGDILNPVKPKELILFTKQFRTLFQAGIPITQLLQVLQNQTESKKLKRVAADMAQAIVGGSTLYDAFKAHPRVFSELYCSMMRAGEASGALGDVMERLVYLLEHEHKIRSDIASAMRYPKMVVGALVIAFFVLLNMVIPKFVMIFSAAKLDLPLPTKIAIAMHHGINNYWPLLLAGLAALTVAYKWWLRTEPGRYWRDSLLLRVPIIGPVLQKSVMARFAAIFSIMQSSGVTVLDALDVLTNTIGNAAIAREFRRIQDKLKEGRGIADPLKSARFFTPLVINMVAIGEESGSLDAMLRDVARHYDEEVEYAVAGMAEAIGPILIVVLAAVVGFFALAIFMPMWDLTKMVGKH
ncbi:type II secretion system F family protein [Nitratidesulfovibrio sp. D1]|uniref:type II secretion system F family protein n=1 Tax=Nitratidesulfovibrio sp. D1 TaxID=3440151 RepID=UPI003EB93EAE